MSAFYNEIDGVAAHVLAALSMRGVIAPGDVSTISIKDLQPDDIKNFAQCHFFAGAGLWSIAARLAGWPDSRPLWTGSCPCQPFSQAGQGRGTADERHLWPDLFRLVSAVRPPVLVGEQVAGAAGYGWLDGVRADLEGEGYACRAVDIPACAMDAPHIRNRIYWVAVADAIGRGLDGRSLVAVGIAERRVASEGHDEGGAVEHAAPDDGELGYPASARRVPAAHAGIYCGEESAGSRNAEPERRNGSFWSNAEWIICHDGKVRRAKPGLRLLVDGMAGRIDLWRLAGNSIVPQLAAEVLSSLMEVLDAGGAP